MFGMLQFQCVLKNSKCSVKAYAKAHLGGCECSPFILTKSLPLNCLVNAFTLHLKSACFLHNQYVAPQLVVRCFLNSQPSCTKCNVLRVLRVNVASSENPSILTKPVQMIQEIRYGHETVDGYAFQIRSYDFKQISIFRDSVGFIRITILVCRHFRFPKQSPSVGITVIVRGNWRLSFIYDFYSE